MKTLYLVRHGVAVPHGTPDVPDDQRPLTAEGERKSRMVGLGLRRHKVKVDKILSSPLPRALRTAEIIATALKATDRIETADELAAGRDADAIAAWLAPRTERRVMVVGHNPWISELLALLTTGARGPVFCDLRKAGVAALEAAEPDATDPDGPPFRVDWLARPRMFRR